MNLEIKTIGLTGTNGAGKGEAVAFFESRSFTGFSLSDQIREELKKKNLSSSRSNMIKTGNEMREKSGSDILARLVMKKVKSKAVIDSIRNPQEIKFLRRFKNFILIAIDAPIEIRFERAQKRGRDESASTLEEFRLKEAEEETKLEQHQQLSKCMQMADFTIHNQGSLDEFNNKLEKFL